VRRKIALLLLTDQAVDFMIAGFKNLDLQTRREKASPEKVS